MTRDNFKTLCSLIAACGLVASAHGQNNVYAVEFNQSDNRFGTVNLLDGSFIQIASLGGMLINDVAYCPLDETLYGLRNNGAELVTFDTTTGQITVIATLSVSGIQSIAFHPGDSVLFGATQSSLYTINTTNGEATFIGNFGEAQHLGTSGQNIRFAQDGNLYVSNTSANTDIYRINTSDGSAVWVGEVTGFPNLILENGGQYMYGVSIAVGAPGGTAPELLGFDLSNFVDGGTNADGSTVQITVKMVGACTNFPVNFNFSGNVAHPIEDPAAPVSAVGPASLTNCPGSTAIFSTTASGTAPYGYTWFKDGVALSGQTNNSLTLDNVGVTDAATYTVIVNGAIGSVTNSATLTVTPLITPEQPQVITGILGRSDGNMVITFSGTPNSTYLVQAATQLANPDWITISTNTAGADGTWSLTDLDATNHPARFYRSSTP